MESSELRQLLNKGILAVKAGDRPLSRNLLLSVLAADETSEPAWLWLSAVLDEPGEQLMALERVLAINPGHPQALAGAQALRREFGQAAVNVQPSAEPSAPEPIWGGDSAPTASSAIVQQPPPPPDDRVLRPPA